MTAELKVMEDPNSASTTLKWQKGLSILVTWILILEYVRTTGMEKYPLKHSQGTVSASSPSPKMISASVTFGP